MLHRIKGTTKNDNQQTFYVTTDKIVALHEEEIFNEELKTIEIEAVAYIKLHDEKHIVFMHKDDFDSLVIQYDKAINMM